MAGRIPQAFINDLIDRVDIVEVIGSRMTLKKTGKNYSGLCPFHDEKTPSFSVSPDKQFFHCFGCQEHGTALGFLMKYDRLEFVEAVEALAGDLGLEVPRERTAGPAPKQVDAGLLDVLAQAEKVYRQALKDAPQVIEYLRSRGLTGEVARDFGIGYAPQGWQTLQEALPSAKTEVLIEAGLLVKNEKGRVYDRFRDRVMFPIRDTKGRVIGFGGRILPGEGGDAQGPKYMNSPETPLFQKSQELYGLFEARKALRQIHRLIVVEGYMDVVALAQFGIQNAVATLGTASGTPHFTKLFRYTDHIVCCFDGDTAGRQAAWKALENALPAMNEQRQLKFVFLPQGEDPDSMVRQSGRQAFEQRLDNAQGAIDFLLSRLSSGLDLSTLDDRARFAALAAPYVERIPQGVLRTLVEQQVSAMSGLRARAARPLNSTQGAPQGARQRSRSASDRLRAHLLALLVKFPQQWAKVEQDNRARLLDKLPAEDALRAVCSYIAENPDAETDELLIWFEGSTAVPDIGGHAAKHLPLTPADVPGEMAGCVTQLLKQLLAEERRAMLMALKESPDEETFRSYLHKRGGNDDYAS